MRKFTSFLFVLFMAMVVKAQTETVTEAVVKMTYVDYNQPSTAMGEIAAGETARAGYNKISDGSVAFANIGYGVNLITYIQVDASSIEGNMIGATLTAEFSGAGNSSRTRSAGWGIGYNSSVWSADVTYETADRTITTVGDVQWTSVKVQTAFETREFDIYDAIKNDADKVVTLVVYETAAGGAYIKNPKVTIKTGDFVPVTGITLDKNTAEITEGMVMNLLSATVAPDNATDKTVTWSSSDENIATVDEGQVKGISVGTATITAEANGFKATCEVTVNAKVVKTSWDFTALLETYGNKAGMTYAVNSVTIEKTDCNYGIGEYEGLAAQGAGGWYLYTSGGLYNGNGGNRIIAILNLKKGQFVTVVTTTLSNESKPNCFTLKTANATLLSQTSADGKDTWVYVMTADGNLGLSAIRYHTIFSIKIEESGDLVVTDGEDFDPEYDYCTSATYTRPITAGAYGTICLPFAPEAESLEAYNFYELTASTVSGIAGEVTFTKVDAPEANKPYIYCLADKDATEAPAITGGATEVSTEAGTTIISGWQMVGSFKAKTVDCTDKAIYALNGTTQNLMKVTKTLAVPAYRAYIEGTSSQLDLQMLTVRISGPTGIEQISAADVEGLLPATIYDLMGRPVQNPQKGHLYIQGGKKVVY